MSKRSKVCELHIPSPVVTEAQIGTGDGVQTFGIIQDSGPAAMYDPDLSKVLERHHFKEVSHGRSFPSKGLFSVSVPDPIDPEASFVYNYFVPNERSFIETDSKNILYDSKNFNAKDIQFLASIDQEPRYVKLTFSPPKFSDVNTAAEKFGLDITEADVEDYFMGSFENIDSTLTLEQIVSKITIEGANSNYNFTGVEIVDTFADKKIYTMLTGSIALLELQNSADSPRERAEMFRRKISEGKDFPNPTGTSKLTLIDILTELQPAGISMAPGDVGDEIAQTATNPITKQSFSVKFNNLFMDDLLKSSTLTANTVFEDELRALLEFSENIQRNAMSNIDPTFTYDHEHQLNVEPLRLNPINITQTQLNEVKQVFAAFRSMFRNHFDHIVQNLNGSDFDFYDTPEDSNMRFLQFVSRGLINPSNFLLKKLGIPKITIVGFMIQKTEVKADGTTQDFPNIFIDNPSSFSCFIDKEVRYGAVYTYKIRTLSIVSSVIAVVNETTESKDFVVADYLVASDGQVISVECVENIPPPAPIRLNAYIDYKYRKPVLTWEFPVNKQRDIKRFQIFKRQPEVVDNNIVAAVDQPFTLVAEYDFDNSAIRTVPNETANQDCLYTMTHPIKKYRDADFNLLSDEAIYAVACVDAHGMSSNYSSQLHIKYDRYTNQLHKNVVSHKEAPKPYPNLYLRTDFFKDLITSSGKKRCNIFFDPEYYKLRIKKKLVDGTVVGFEDINYLKTSDVDFNYTFQMVNIDLQEEQSIKIRIADRSGETVGVPVAKISPTNLNFEFGSKN